MSQDHRKPAEVLNAMMAVAAMASMPPEMPIRAMPPALLPPAEWARSTGKRRSRSVSGARGKRVERRRKGNKVAAQSRKRNR